MLIMFAETSRNCSEQIKKDGIFTDNSNSSFVKNWSMSSLDFDVVGTVEIVKITTSHNWQIANI